MKTKLRYPVVLIPGLRPLKPNHIVDGRIHPFGDHYRVIGFHNLIITPFILDPEIFFDSYERSEMKDLESIKIKSDSSFVSIMSKYPCHWIDNMCKIHGVKERLKKDKIKAIEERIIKDMPSIWTGLSPHSKEVVRICLENGGYVKIGKLKDFEDDTSFFWKKEKGKSTPIGDLRRKGLLVIGKMKIESRNFTVAFIPKEFRGPLSKCH